MEPDASVNDLEPDRQLGHSQSQQFTNEKDVKLPAARIPVTQRSLARSIAIVATCTAALLIQTSNATSASISLPSIGKSINIQEDQLQWLLSAFSLSSGCLILFFGRLADLYGRRKVFIAGTCWQMIFSLAIGFSSNGITLDILRGFQGMGGAAAIPACLGILAHSFPPSRARSIAFATFAAGAPLGGAAGNVFGGVLTQLSPEHWRATFFLSAAFSASCLISGLMSFDADKPSTEVDARVDWIGAILVTSGLVLIVFVLGQGQIAGWKTPYIIVCLVVGVVLLAIFVAWEHHLEKSPLGPDKPKTFWSPPPLMKLSIFARAKGRMSVILAIAFLNWAGFISWTFWVQLYYQDYKQLTPVLTMVRFIPMLVMGCLCNLAVALVVGQLPLVVFVVMGTLIAGFASVLFALIDTSAPFWTFGFPSSVMIVFGADFVYATGTIFVAKLALPHEQSLAGGLLQTMTQVGTAFGLTISTIVFNKVVDAQLAELGVALDAVEKNIPPLVQLQGYRSALWTCASFAFLASLLAVVFLRQVGIVGHRKHEDPSEQTITEEQMDCQP